MRKVGDNLVEIGPAGAGTLAEVVDDEEGQVRLSSNRGEVAEEGTGAVEAGLAAGGGAGQGVDHDKGRPGLVDHLDEMELLRRLGKVYGAGRVGSEHEEEAAAVDVPGLGTLVEEGGRVLGIDDEYVAARARSFDWLRTGCTVGKGVVVDDAASKVEGDKGFADAGAPTQEGEHAARDPGGPEPVDGREPVRDLVEG